MLCRAKSLQVRSSEPVSSAARARKAPPPGVQRLPVLRLDVLRLPVLPRLTILRLPVLARLTVLRHAVLLHADPRARLPRHGCRCGAGQVPGPRHMPWHGAPGHYAGVSEPELC